MSEQLIIGNASHLYAVQEGWGQLPANIQYGYTHGIVVDDEDRVYVHHTGKESVVVFDKNGSFLTSWGSEFEGGAHGFTCTATQMGSSTFILQTPNVP